MKLTIATLLASASMLTFAQAATLDLTDAAFANTFDGGIPASAIFDGVTFTITPTAKGVDGFRGNAQGLSFGTPGNGMFSMSIVADRNISLNAITGVDLSLTAQTTGVLFDGMIGTSSVFADLIFDNPIAEIDFADVILDAGDAFLVTADLSARSGFNSVFAAATIGSIDFSNVPTPPVSPVPLPAGGFLFLSGLAGVAAFKRRTKCDA